MGIAIIYFAIPFAIFTITLGQKEKGKVWAKKAYPWSIALLIGAVFYLFIHYIFN